MKQFVSQCQRGQIATTTTSWAAHTYPLYISVHPHTLTALALLLAWLFYAAVRTNYEGTETSVKLGISAAMGCFVFIGMLQFRDGPFIRPSIPFWRAVLSLSVLYQLLLVFLLFLASTILDDPSSSFSMKILTSHIHCRIRMKHVNSWSTLIPILVDSCLNDLMPKVVIYRWIH